MWTEGASPWGRSLCSSRRCGGLPTHQRIEWSLEFQTDRGGESLGAVCGHTASVLGSTGAVLSLLQVLGHLWVPGLLPVKLCGAPQ